MTYSEAVNILNRSTQNFVFPTEVSDISLIFPSIYKIPVVLFPNLVICSLFFYSGVVTFRKNMKSIWWNIVEIFQSLSLITPMNSSLFMQETTKTIRSIQ